MPLLHRNHSHTIPYCDIRLDEDVVVLRGSPTESAGALLKGRLAFCLSETIPVRSISLTLVGTKLLHWQERISTATGIAMKTIKHEEVIYEKKWQFLEFAHKHAVTLKPDNYEYDFGVVISGDLPESIEGLENAHVFYRLKAVIDRPRFAQNIVAKKHLRIVRTLNAEALELSQTMSVENLWPNKVEYCISIPNKATVFGSSIPFDIILLPLLKGLTIGKITCSLKELHNFTIPHKDSNKSDVKTIVTQTFECAGLEEEEDCEDFGKYKLHDRVELPKSLAKCVQDCETESIKVRHKLKFTIQLHNPDGHTSELRASLPVMLFISPNLLMDEDNTIRGNGSSDEIHGAHAPPRYDDHYLDRLYDGISRDRFETPLPSRANTPAVLSRNNSHENLAVLSITDPARVSGAVSPLRIPDTSPSRWPTNRHRTSTSVPLAPPTAGTFSNDELAARLNSHEMDDNLSSRPGRFTRSGPSTRAHSPEDLHGEDENLDFNKLSKVPSYTTAAVIARLLSENIERTISFSATYDNVPLAGIFQAEIKSSKKAVEAPFHVENADVAVVNDIALLSKFDLIARTKQGGSLILKSTIKDEDFEKKFPAPFKRAVAQKGINLVILDPSVIGEEASAAVGNALVQLAFLRIANVSASLEKLSIFNLDAEAVHLAAEKLDGALRKIETPKEWSEAVDENEVTDLPALPQVNSFTINEEKHVVEPTYILRSNQSAAQALSFREAYGIQSALRPDLGMRNYIVKVKENKRLTPDYYDRNIFHIEFDLTGTGMEYDIGEALGIHAQNDPKEVTEFIGFYGLNMDDIVEVPSRDDPEVLEIRTVFQALSQNVDLFGRPPKRFYEGLAEFAENVVEKNALLNLSSAEGAAEFKRRAEEDTCTFADILREYPSAHPDFYDLVRIVSPMKRREYSIASSQKTHPDAVHLLIVVVNWVDPKGRERFGQATRFLSTLSVGSEVTVSVKPSVMKLPPSSTQPLIMAGLGTGLAPFRAFVEYRAWQKAQGMEIGPILLYMGARHRREEYLYGEEWEAYEAAGIVTLLSCAFSRDQPQKIYIQDRMRQTLDDIIKAYIKEDGAFYLCGPTWPVPDVTDVLQEAIVEGGRREGKKVDGAKKIDELKDKGRYVLEVY